MEQTLPPPHLSVTTSLSVVQSSVQLEREKNLLWLERGRIIRRDHTELLGSVNDTWALTATKDSRCGPPSVTLGLKCVFVGTACISTLERFLL